MSQPEEITRPTEVIEEVARTTDDIGEIRQTTEEFEQLPQMNGSFTQLPQTTEEFEQLPRIDIRRKVTYGRRSAVRQQTDALPQLSVDTTGVKSTWRQAVHLREENMRLRVELEETRSELRQMMHAYSARQAEHESEVRIIHHGQQQEIDQYQDHLRAMMEERNRIQEAYHRAEQRYQELYHSFQDAVEEEARKIVAGAVQQLEQPSAEVPTLLQDVVKSLELHTTQIENQHLMEALYLKSRIKQMVAQLDIERQQVEIEHQHLMAMQQTAREQAELRQKLLHQRFRARWKVVSLFALPGSLALLVVLQFVFLFVFQIHLFALLSLSLLAPVLLCSLLTLTYSRLYKLVKPLYESAPHKQKVQS